VVSPDVVQRQVASPAISPSLSSPVLSETFSESLVENRSVPAQQRRRYSMGERPAAEAPAPVPTRPSRPRLPEAVSEIQREGAALSPARRVLESKARPVRISEEGRSESWPIQQEVIQRQVAAPAPAPVSAPVSVPAPAAVSALPSVSVPAAFPAASVESVPFEAPAPPVISFEARREPSVEPWSDFRPSPAEEIQEAPKRFERPPLQEEVWEPFARLEAETREEKASPRLVGPREPSAAPPAAAAAEIPLRVHIGRIEVRAAAEPVAPRSKPAAPRLSLSDYLRRRGGKG
jgi:hypothetical protein